MQLPLGGDTFERLITPVDEGPTTTTTTTTTLFVPVHDTIVINKIYINKNIEEYKLPQITIRARKEGQLYLSN